MTKKIILLIFVSIIAFLINTLQPFENLGFYNTNQSAPKGFYLISNSAELEKGQYVILSIPENAVPIIQGRAWFKSEIPLLKKIGALPGDVVTISDEGLFINYIYIGPVFITDRQGLPLPQIRKTFTIKENEFLPISTYERSFDGRYFGPISLNSIKNKVTPIWTY